MLHTGGRRPPVHACSTIIRGGGGGGLVRVRACSPNAGQPVSTLRIVIAAVQQSVGSSKIQTGTAIARVHAVGSCCLQDATPAWQPLSGADEQSTMPAWCCCSAVLFMTQSSRPLQCWNSDVWPY